MIDISNAVLDNAVLHHLGSADEQHSLVLSSQALDLSVPDLYPTLLRFFLSSFREPDYFQFSFSNGSPKLNPVYQMVQDLFKHPDSLVLRSVELAGLLREKSTHPQIKAGDFYVSFFKKVALEGQEYRAIGLYKSESKQPFLFTETSGSAVNLELKIGTLPEKLDKGCLILETEAEEGYKILTVDRANKGQDAQYWMDDFLHLSPRTEAFRQTRDFLDLTRHFVTEQLASEFQINRADQADLLNKSIGYFKDREVFDKEDFAQTVLHQPEVVDSFHRFTSQYATENQMEIRDEFEISEHAVKKQQRVYKSVLKLDKNFHIYVHGNRELIERGFDQGKGLHYYKVYFESES